MKTAMQNCNGLVVMMKTPEIIKTAWRAMSRDLSDMDNARRAVRGTGNTAAAVAPWLAALRANGFSDECQLPEEIPPLAELQAVAKAKADAAASKEAAVSAMEAAIIAAAAAQGGKLENSYFPALEAVENGRTAQEQAALSLAKEASDARREKAAGNEPDVGTYHATWGDD